MTVDYEKLAKDIQSSFLSLLKSQLPSVYLEKVRNGKKIKILSLCCGRFRESKSIYDYFAGFENFIKLYGIDSDKNLLELAETEPSIIKNRRNVELMLGDASKFDSYKPWMRDGGFDLIIYRHSEVLINREAFLQVISRSTMLFNSGAYLLTTTHYKEEKDELKLVLHSLKFKILKDIENPNPANAEKDGMVHYADRFLLLASL